MKRKALLVSLLTLSVATIVGCGGRDSTSTSTAPTPSTSSSTSSTPTTKTELTIALNYDGTNNRITYQQDAEYKTPKGTTIKKGDYKPVWSTLQTALDFKATEVVEACTTKAVTYFKENWQTKQFADLAAANVADINTFSVAGDKETILDISQYLDKLPNFKAFLDENPAVRMSITSAKHGNASQGAIYYFPYFDGYDDLEKMTLVRADYVKKIFSAEETALDTNTTLVNSVKYHATEADEEGYAPAYKITVPKALDSTETKEISKAKVKNIVVQQNALIDAGTASSKTLVKQFKDYVTARYGTQITPENLFLGVDSCYDADEMVALMRIMKASPKALTGSETKKVVAFVPREYNNQRIADLYRWAGQLWGVRGVESRSGYLYINKEGAITDIRGEEGAVEMLENLHSLYEEGLILENFQNQSAAGVSDGKFAQSLIVGHGNDNYVGFMEYDYSQTQGVWNDKAASTAIADYNFRPILGGVANWDDGDDETGYFHFTESWRSVKTQGLVLNADLKNDTEKLNKALAVCDYFWSEEGHQLNSYGPESEGYTSGTINYQGKTVAKFTTEALQQLNDANIGKGSYTDYLRKFVGATLPVGYIKEQGMEYQATSANAIAGLDVINKAIEVGTYKHVTAAETENPFFKIVPSSFFLTKGAATEIAKYTTKEKLGSINSDGSISTYNIWDNYVMHGFNNAAKSTLSKEEYLETINEDYGLEKVVAFYYSAYLTMTA